MFFLLNFSNPMLWVLILAAIFLLFGGSKLPQLAKALGQSKKAFKDGLSEAEEEEDKKRKEVAANQPAPLSAVDDDALFEEARRRARLRVGEGVGEDRK